jgi:hypothetical protein
MASVLGANTPGVREGLRLEPYTAALQFTSLVRGTDNIHYDVYLSPQFVEAARRYVLDLVRQVSNLQLFYGSDLPGFKPPETVAFRKLLTELLKASLIRAQYEKNIELDLLLRVSLLKFFVQETSNQFSHIVLECKQWMRARGSFFENSPNAHRKNAALQEIQANRRNVYRQAGQTLYQLLEEIEESTIRKTRRALFGEEFAARYEVLRSRLVFVEGFRDDLLLLEHYVVIGNYIKDPDRIEQIEEILFDLLRGFVLSPEEAKQLESAKEAVRRATAAVEARSSELVAVTEARDDARRRLERSSNTVGRLLSRSSPEEIRASLAELDRQVTAVAAELEKAGRQLEEVQQQTAFVVQQIEDRLGSYLNEPSNARRMFEPQAPAHSTEVRETRARLLEEWVRRLEGADLTYLILASYELRNVYLDFCPPLHLQQIRKALVSAEERKRVAETCAQFPARRFPLEKIEDLARAIRRYPPDHVRAILIRFAEDFLRLRRDLQNARRLEALMESVNLVVDDRTRSLSRANNSLYEFLMPEEERPSEDRITSHAILKVDVRESTRITHELLSRGLNPASHFSLSLYEPVRRLLDNYGARKVFIEGDAIILAIYETEANRAHQRAVAMTCLLARDILAIARVNNARAEESKLPPLPMGLGIAYEGTAPTIWQEGDSQIMISRALNLSDRLSSCSKAARRLLLRNPSPFNVFLFQTVAGEVKDDEADEFLIRYNMNGVELNAEGFAKLEIEVSLMPLKAEFTMPWGREPVILYYGEIPRGNSLEPLLIRKGIVRKLVTGNEIGEAGTRAYYEVCTDAKLIELVESKVNAAVRKS